MRILALCASLLVVQRADASIFDALLPRATVVASTSTSSAVSNCSAYAVQSGDTCFTIASAYNVTWAQLMAWNSDLSGTCSNLQDVAEVCVSNPQGTYSMPVNTVDTEVGIMTTTAAIPSPTGAGSNSVCGQWYNVVGGDTCEGISAEFSITLSDFLFLNPEVWTNCTNLLADYYYCVEAVGYLSTYAGYGGTTTTSVFNQTAVTAVPYVANLLANYSSSQPTIPYANRTRNDCYSYLWLSNTTDNELAQCWNLPFVYDLTAEELVLWNPSLADADASAEAATTTVGNSYTYPCTLAASSSYCVRLMSSTSTISTLVTPTPVSAYQNANCTTWFAPKSYTLCSDIPTSFDLDLAKFYDWNPTVGEDCSGLAVGTYYCIGTSNDEILEYDDLDDSTTATAVATTSSGVSTPSPVQSGIVSKCDDFYDVVAGDGCWAIANSYSIDLDDFYAWNPAVGTDCSGLEAGVYVCVRVGSSTSAAIATTVPSTTVAAAATTTTGNGITTPTPTQTGMVSSCDEFYDVVAGDGCWAIANSYSIDLDDFYSWNPAVGTDCSGLEAGVYVCVGVL